MRRVLDRIVVGAFALGAALATLAGAADDRRGPIDPAELALRIRDSIAPMNPTRIKFKRGDDPEWAKKDFDDSTWTPISGRELPSRDGIYWVRWRVTQRFDRPFLPRDGLMFKVVASYDVYWDGRLIARSGRVSAERDDEGPGSVDALFQIPSDLIGAGEHVIALRMSSWNTGFPGPTYALNFFWGNFQALLLERSRTSLLSVMAVGAALVAAVVFGLLWLLAGRRRSLLLFSLLCLTVAVLQALQAWRWLFDYPYDWHYPRLVAITGVSTALAVLLPAFLLEHFILKWRGLVYATLLVFLTYAWLSSPIYNRISLVACGVGFGVAFGVAIGAVWRRRRGSWFACGGIAWSLMALNVAPRDFLDHAFFISAGPAVLGLMVAVVLQLRDERREAQRAVLTAARLEIELLKKNIQPHFLLNTLATIQAVIEQEPRTAVTLIDALAGEFRILNRVSGERLIPIEQELELCRAHLHVMSLRKGAGCTLEVSGIDPGAGVPPALFHTLIENGLTHLLPRNGRLEFELRAERLPAGMRYTLRARGERQALPSVNSAATNANEAVTEGTGLRYIKARLEESFTGRWTLSGAPVSDGWETVIEIHAPEAGGSVPESADAPVQPKEQPA
jgi:hypothetical protein